MPEGVGLGVLAFLESLTEEEEEQVEKGGPAREKVKIKKIKGASEGIKELLKYYRANYPSIDSVGVNLISYTTVPANSVKTIRYSVSKGWKARISDVFIDSLIDSDYLITVSDVKIESNEYTPAKPIPVRSEETITFQITNNQGSDRDYGYRLKGWGNKLR